jgi:hypothetical protein
VRKLPLSFVKQLQWKKEEEFGSVNPKKSSFLRREEKWNRIFFKVQTQHRFCGSFGFVQL